MKYSKRKQYEKYARMVGDKILKRGARSHTYHKSQQRSRAFARDLNRRDPLSERWFKDATPAYLLLDFKQNREVSTYIGDFVWEEYRIIIEIDDISHTLGDNSKCDQVRDAYLNAFGWYVIRVRHKDTEELKIVHKFLKSLTYWNAALRNRHVTAGWPYSRPVIVKRFLQETLGLRVSHPTDRLKTLGKKSRHGLKKELEYLTNPTL